MESEQEYCCWQCGVELKELMFPISRRDECPSCRAELHVCRFCQHFDSRVADQCREDRAEAVTDKQAANFCDFFSPSTQAFSAQEQKRGSDARSAAEALFSGGAESESDLADGGARGESRDEKAEQARAELKKLFGDED